MISCRETSRLLSDSLDRNLSLRERIPMRLHLLMCKFCRRFSRQVDFLRGTLNRYIETMEGERPLLDDSLSFPAREKLKKALAGGSLP